MSISLDSHKRWPLADRHPWICWPIARPFGPYNWQLENRRPVPDFVTSPSAAKKTTPDVIYFTEAPGGPFYVPAMSQQTYPAPFDSDMRIDYALIVAGVGAALFAFIYLILV